MYTDYMGYANDEATGKMQGDPSIGTASGNVDYKGRMGYTGETWDPWGYGGRGPSVVDSRTVPGTSHYDRAVDRYQGMGSAASGRRAPTTVDPYQLNSRKFQMGSLGMLEAAAQGRGPSIAGQEAIRAGQSLAGSVRGGPGARIAAMRNATAQAGSQYAMARAKEMADARGQLFGASTGMRGQDIDVLKTRTDAEARQRALNAQEQQAYEKMGADVRRQELDAQIARSGSILGGRNTRQEEGDVLPSDARAKNLVPMGSLAALMTR